MIESNKNMPKATQTSARPKEQTVLKEPRYENKTAIKSLNSYEKILSRQLQDARTIARRAPRARTCADKGELSLLFATTH